MSSEKMHSCKYIPRNIYSCLIVYFLLLFHQCGPVISLVQISSFHRLYEVFPTKHQQLHFLNLKRLSSPELIFWNGIGGLRESVFILCCEEAAAKHQSEFDQKNLHLTMKYNLVKIAYVEHNLDHPNDVLTNTNLENEGLLEASESGSMPTSFLEESEDIEEKLSHGDTMDDHYEAEVLIYKRKNRYDSDLTEAIGVVPRSYGLLPVMPVKGVSGRKLSINSGILYRIQGVQTLYQSNLTSPENGEWTTPKSDGSSQGHIPRVGEYFAVSFSKKRSGSNPYITAEEDNQYWKNNDYLVNRTKAALWMFVPTEYDKFYEIRSRNYPASLLVWNYDVDEGEFILNMETRREYLRRYRPEGVLRNRALFSFQLISESYSWELRHDRPKYYLITYNSNHVYMYESKKKGCTVLIVRNSATEPYIPEKTDKFNRHLDMFYITRLNLAGRYTASIYSFMYEKSIVDIFARSAEDMNVNVLSDFELSNRTPLPTTQYLFEEVPFTNEYEFQFQDSFREFQWVTIEAHVPSFGVAPTIQTGAIGQNTNTNQIIITEVDKLYKIKDKVMLESGYRINSSVIFQYIKEFSNPFTALMEVTEPADRLYWDKEGKPRFVRLSLPGSFAEKTWNTKAKFSYDRVIERREAAIVVQIRGTLISTYGLRAFVRKAQTPYSPGIVTCDTSV